MTSSRFFAAIAAMSVTFAAGAAGAVTYNPADDFTTSNGNPNGIYSYGYENTLGGALNLFTTPSGADKWYSPAVDFFLGDYLGSGKILQHPGPQAQVSVLRLTLPQSGNFTIAGAFSNADNATTDVHIFVDGVSIFSNTIDAKNNGNLSDPFSFLQHLNVGDTVDFVVGNGGDGYFFDSTFLSVTLSTAGVPEPAAWALMLVGFGGVGLTIRRRARDAAAPV